MALCLNCKTPGCDSRKCHRKTALGLRNRLINMLAKLRASDNHPVWYAGNESMGIYISRRLNIETGTGQPIDEFYVARLESYMPKPRRRAVSDREAALAAFVLQCASDNPAGSVHVSKAAKLLDELGIAPRETGVFYLDRKAELRDTKERLSNG